jgi:hypothetical protein
LDSFYDYFLAHTGHLSTLYLTIDFLLEQLVNEVIAIRHTIVTK